MAETDPAEANRLESLAAEKGYARAQKNLARSYMKGRDGLQRDTAQALRWIRAAINQGCPDAEYTLGQWYDEGTGVQRDSHEAFECYRRSAERGFLPALVNLGFCYMIGRGVDANPAKAVRLYQQAADRHFPPAQSNLASCYREGTGVGLNPARAFELYLKAAEAGYLPAQCWVGTCYDKGIGVAQDEAKAFQWYLKAAEAGNVTAQVNVAIDLRYGIGTPLDLVKAGKWFKEAADKMDHDALCHLADFHRFGLGGFSTNLTAAAKCYERSAVLFNRDGMAGLGQMYCRGEGVAKSPSRGMSYHVRALAFGRQKSLDDIEAACKADPECGLALLPLMKTLEEAAGPGAADLQDAMGQLYAKGIGVQKDFEKAAVWFKKAARQNHANAMVNLGLLFDHGNGVSKDHRRAAELFRQAADLGDPCAMANLAVCHQTGRGAKHDLKAAAELHKKAAAKGWPQSIATLGFFYSKGYGGLPKDEKKAVEYYREAVKHNDPYAMLNMAAALLDARVVEPDTDEAARLVFRVQQMKNEALQPNINQLVSQYSNACPAFLEKLYDLEAKARMR